ncbi:hypothetical protein O9929_26015 [Vibrio lentus]|nr:hypothetical protein [Vibrio lentus]
MIFSPKGIAKAVDGQVLTDIEADIGSTLPMINAQQALAIARPQYQGVAAATILIQMPELGIWLDGA